MAAVAAAVAVAVVMAVAVATTVAVAVGAWVVAVAVAVAVVEAAAVSVAVVRNAQQPHTVSCISRPAVYRSGDVSGDAGVTGRPCLQWCRVPLSTGRLLCQAAEDPPVLRLSCCSSRPWMTCCSRWPPAVSWTSPRARSSEGGAHRAEVVCISEHPGGRPFTIAAVYPVYGGVYLAGMISEASLISPRRSCILLTTGAP